MARLSDIAETLGISKTTVSKALNDSSDISAETKARVFAEAERLGYVARKRRTQPRERIIGVACPEVTSSYYSQIVTNLNNNLQRKGYSTIFTLSSFSPENERNQIDLLTSLKVAGIVVVTEQEDISPTLANVSSISNIPVVVIGLNYESKINDVVSVDDAFGVCLLVEQLIANGYTEFGFIGDRLVQNRFTQLKRCLKEHSLSLSEDCVVMLDERNEDCGYHAMQQLLARPTRPQVVIAGYDLIALGAYRALTEAGLRVPEDMALAGFDNSDFCDFLPSSLTSIDCNVPAQCQVATAILVSRIESDELSFTQNVAIIPHLVERESTVNPNKVPASDPICSD